MYLFYAPTSLEDIEASFQTFADNGGGSIWRIIVNIAAAFIDLFIYLTRTTLDPARIYYRPTVS